MSAPEQILLFVLTFFGEPVMFMNATVYGTIDACEASSVFLKIPTDERIDANFYCVWRDANPESMPVLTEGFTPEQMAILKENGFEEKVSGGE